MKLHLGDPRDEMPVSLRRWLKWRIGKRLAAIGARWEFQALYPNHCPICRTMHKGDDCDPIPF